MCSYYLCISTGLTVTFPCKCVGFGHHALPPAPSFFFGRHLLHSRFSFVFQFLLAHVEVMLVFLREGIQFLCHPPVPPRDNTQTLRFMCKMAEHLLITCACLSEFFKPSLDVSDTQRRMEIYKQLLRYRLGV